MLFIDWSAKRLWSWCQYSDPPPWRKRGHLIPSQRSLLQSSNASTSLRCSPKQGACDLTTLPKAAGWNPYRPNAPQLCATFSWNNNTIPIYFFHLRTYITYISSFFKSSQISNQILTLCKYGTWTKFGHSCGLNSCHFKGQAMNLHSA